MGPDGADEAAHKATNLHPARPPARSQQRGHETPLAVEHNDRLEAVIVIVGIEQAQLLAAMHPVEGVVDIENDAPRHRSQRAAILLERAPSPGA